VTQLSLGVRPDTARFSECGTYRYNLTRELGGERPLVICGLNPSVATRDKNDPTIRREIGFAKLWQSEALGGGMLLASDGFIYSEGDVEREKRRFASQGIRIVRTIGELGSNPLT